MPCLHILLEGALNGAEIGFLNVIKQLLNALTRVAADDKNGACARVVERVGEQWTDMRAQLFNVIVGLDRPASAYDIADRFSEQRGRRVAANSVYRILDLFVAANIVTRVEVANRYLPNVHPGCVHDCILLFCEQCGRITHLDDDNIATSIRGAATNAGFRPTKPVIEVCGLCEACSR